MGVGCSYTEVTEEVNIIKNGNYSNFDGQEKLYSEMWDALHFLLVGCSAFNAVFQAVTLNSQNDNILSEAIIGTVMISDKESGDYIAYIPADRVKKIAKTLEQVPNQTLNKNFLPELMAKKNIYPDTLWLCEKKDIIIKTLSDSFNELKMFYRKVANKDNSVIINLI